MPDLSIVSWLPVVTTMPDAEREDGKNPAGTDVESPAEETSARHDARRPSLPTLFGFGSVAHDRREEDPEGTGMPGTSPRAATND